MNNIAIVTTTIAPPTEATIKFAQTGLPFYIAGDQKTPHELYYKLANNYSNVRYLDPARQELMDEKLSNAIGWKCIQRRNFGYLAALEDGCEVIATVDDDNIPYVNWGEKIHIGNEIEVEEYSSPNGFFDPLMATNYPHLWHRGYPIDLVPNRKVEFIGRTMVTPDVQADLWDGDPDIDAICRLTYKPICKFNTTIPFYSKQMSPFNSQNTFINRKVMQYYMVLPFVGRMDDIWGGYLARLLTKCTVIYNKASVYQARNPQNLVKNLEGECIGYYNTEKMLKSSVNDNGVDFFASLPDETKNAYTLYRAAVDRI